MKTKDLSLPISIEELRKILRKYGVKEASIIGSYARADATGESDLDLVVKYQDGVSLFDHFDLKQELEAKIGCSVDLVSDRALSRHMRPVVDRERVAVL